jgi:predicted O-methyltransferase YrrM
MSDSWQSIDGWFDFEDIYEEAVRDGRDGHHFVEVGSWLGRSTAFMGRAIRESGKAIRFDAVDTWIGCDAWQHKVVAREGGSILQRFTENMRRCGVADHVHPVVGASVDVATRYADASIDLVFIDATHEFASVIADVRAWLPKVKPGGVLAGHDYNLEPVRSAVTLELPRGVVRRHSSWWHRKPERMT